MATAVQPLPFPDAHTFHQQRQPRQAQQHQAYTAAIPFFPDTNAIIGNAQPNLFKQINIIPGLDAENAVVDTGVKLVRPTGTQGQISSNTAAANDYDGKRMRRSIQRRTVDYNASAIQTIKHRLYRRSILQKPIVQPDPLYYLNIVQPQSIRFNPINSVTTRFVRASTNKVRCPVFTVAWTPEGRRVVTGTSSGEFTLWNGLTFNFETILQAHESAVRAMQWSHNDMWLLSGDHNGVVKYWQSNMNNVKMIQAHTDPIRGLSFCPTDNKFVTCSDDGLLKIWDFYRCVEENALRGHGADVKCVDWHPSKSIIASGSKDSQQPLKLWDPKSGISLATIHGHKSTVMDLDWNKNGNWLLTGSRDRLVKVFDIRVMKEMFTLRGHKKEAASVNWHPIYEEMFASGGSDGSIMFWLLGCEKELGVMENAHDGMIWDLKWHPLGHILCSGSNDHTTKFWTRNRPGDKMRDKYNLNILPTGFEDDYEYELPNNSQSEGDTTAHDSTLNSTVMSTDTPVKAATVVNGIDKSDLDSPIVKALLEQTSLEVTKRSSKETPAQIFTVSQLRPTAPAFKIEAEKQKQALEEVERLEKRRERQLRRGSDKGSKRRRAHHDDVAAANAPSLLDLNIAPPAFLKDHDWEDDSQDAPFIGDAKFREGPSADHAVEEQQRSSNRGRSEPQGLPKHNNNQRSFDAPPTSHYNGQNDSKNLNHRRPQGNESRFDGPPSHSNSEMNHHFGRPDFNHTNDRLNNFDGNEPNRYGETNNSYKPHPQYRNDGNNVMNDRPPRFDKRNEFHPHHRWEEEQMNDRWFNGDNRGRDSNLDARPNMRDDGRR